MMPVTAQELAKLKTSVGITYLVKFAAGGVSYRFTTSDSNDFYQSETYLPGYIDFDGIDEIEVTSDLKINNTKISIDAADNTILSVFLASDWMNKPCSIIKLITDSSGALLMAKTVLNGFLSAVSIDPTKSKVKLTAASIWADYEKTSGIKTNNKSQQRHYPTDTAFEHSQAAMKKIYWGADAPRNQAGSRSGGGGGTVTEKSLTKVF